MMIRPLLVSFSDLGGGAARAAYRLNHALRGAGMDSRLAVRRKLSDDDSVLEFPRRAARWNRTLRGRAERGLQRLQHTSNPVVHSANLVPSRWGGHLQADVVNLHWIGGGALSVEDVARIRAPVVLTLHDMWAFCGSEHYAPDHDEARWAVGYTRHNCPDGQRGVDLDRLTWQRKRRHWLPMTVVAPSRWLADCVRRSALMAEWPVHVVPNPLELDVFEPMDRGASRQALGLPPDRPVVLFGALGGDTDPRKGFDLLAAALQRLEQPETVLGVVFGGDEPADPPRVGHEVRWLGHTDDDLLLARIYAAADVMVVPSRQDNLPQTAIEAQACGTPVVAFDTAGLPDTVEDRVTGYLAAPLDPRALADGITWVLEDPDRRARLGDAARRRAERLWHPATIAMQYRDVYRAAMADGEPDRAGDS